MQNLTTLTSGVPLVSRAQIIKMGDVTLTVPFYGMVCQTLART